jgi:predicted nucleic acid-binding protein
MPYSDLPKHLRPRPLRLSSVVLVGGTTVVYASVKQTDDVAAMLVAAGGLLAGLAVLGLIVRRARRVIRDNNTALETLRSGQWSAALTTFETIARSCRDLPTLHGLTMHNMASAAERAGDPEYALTLWRAARRRLSRTRSRWILSEVAAAVARCKIRQGDLEGAAEAVEAARGYEPGPNDLLIDLAELALKARSGTYQEVADDAPALLTAGQDGLGSFDLNELRVLHAFCLQELGRTDEAGQALAAIPQGADLAWTLGSWEELGAFLRDRGLLEAEAGVAPT